MVKKLHETLSKVFAYANRPEKDLGDVERNALISAQQYLLVLNLARHGIQFGDPDLAPLAWLLHLSKHGSKEDVLKKESLSSFFKCSEWTDILDARREA